MLRKIMSAIGILAALLPVVSHAFPIPALDSPPRRTVCLRTGDAPLIDGRLDDEVWQIAPWTEDFIDIQGDTNPTPRHRTRVRLLWDDEHLYVAADLQEPHVWASLTERDAVIYHDNDFEVFIDPDGDNHLYYELEINALNTVWDLLLIKPYRDGGPAVNAWDIPGLRTAVAIDGTLNDPSDRDQGWSVEIAIPWRALTEAAGRPAPPTIGDIWRINFSRVQWRTRNDGGQYTKITDAQTGEPVPEDNWVWSPQGLVAMHYPERWGEVMFVGLPPGEGPWASHPEHETIRIAHALMPLYYRQREFHDENGRFAASPTELGLSRDTLPMRTPGRTLDLVSGWHLEMTGGDDWFHAKLFTAAVVVTLDHEGRLTRSEP